MSKKINNLIIVILAVVVFFTGAGVTVINFCCSECKLETLFIDDDTCCTLEKYVANEIDSKNCCSTQVEANSFDNLFDDANKHCSTARVSIDIDSSVSRPNIAIPFAWSSDLLFTPQYSLFQSKESPNKCEYMESPPIIAPRSYLSIIRVLII